MLQVNFLPWREKQKARAAKRFMMLVAGYAICAVAAVGIVYGYLRHWHHINHNVQQGIENAASLLQKRIEQTEILQQRLDYLSAIVEQIERYRQSVADITRWLLVIETTLPETLWLKQIAFQGGVLTISGQGWAKDDVVKFLRSLELSLTDSQFHLIEMTEAPESRGEKVIFTLQGRRVEVLL